MADVAGEPHNTRWSGRALVCLVLALAVVLSVAGSAAAATVSSSEGLVRPTFDRRVAFGVAPSADLHSVLAAAGAWGELVESPLVEAGVQLILPTRAGASELCEALSRIDGVLWAEPERSVEAMAAPNDPLYWDQDAILRMQVARAWETSPGSAGITVAVVDSGVGPHPDLTGRVLPGYNLTDPDHPGDTADVNPAGHGTAVAGIIAAAVHNSSGIAGVAQRVRILPVVVLTADGLGTDVGAAEGIAWAVDRGADVINVSLGSQWFSTALESAVRYADQHGVVVVAAVGNDGNGQVRYPAAFPEVIAVAATDNADEHLTSSNQGPEVDVAAPGVHVLSTGFLDAGHTAPTVMSFSGTSFSAALVSGVAALILSKDPSLDPGAVRALIERGAKDILPAGRDYATGAGRVDAAASLALMAGGVVPGDATAPRAPLAVAVTPVFGTQMGRVVTVQSPPDSDRTGVIVRRTLIRPARASADGVFVGSDVTGDTTVELTDTLPAGTAPGSVFYYTAFARDAAGNASNPAWAYAVVGELSPGTELPPGPTSFTDVAADHPFAEAITALSRAGVVTGFADGSFRPDESVARAQFAKMVVLAVGVPLPLPGASPTFGDVPASTGYPFIYVEAAAAAGIVKGLAATTPSGEPLFGPYQNVSRVQVALMLGRAGGEKLDPPPAGILHPFYDVPSFADAEVQRIWAMGIARGRSAVTFEPWASATRGQVAQMLFHLRTVLQARP